VTDSTPTVIGLVTQGLAEVKDAVSQLSRDLHGTLARLPNDYVPRREVERWRDERTIEVGALRAEIAAERTAREEAIKGLEDAHDRAERDRRVSRRWVIGTGLATAGSAAGVLFGIIDHFS
jgi:hypothetical protein